MSEAPGDNPTAGQENGGSARVKPCRGPAGGWGSLKAGSRHVLRQGGRTVGITEQPAPGFLDSLGKAFGFQPPRGHGYHVVEAIRAMSEGKVDVFFALGGNFAAASPDSVHTCRALERCGLTVHVSTRLNRSHTVVGRDALILPCLGRTELDVTGYFPELNPRVSVNSTADGSHTPTSKFIPVTVVASP
jgi:anaerobic selenocysteine-containing dehydrogenase